jgi:hypothetical protein
MGLPYGKSPSHDCFNTNFMKKCWTTISQNFYDLCLDFYNNNLPISLLNSSNKLITKVLASILQSMILKIVHQNQYGFIKSRSI